MKISDSIRNIENLGYLEQLYLRHRQNRRSVPKVWREYFSAALGNEAKGEVQFGPSFRPRSLFNPAEAAQSHAVEFRLDPREASLHERLIQLIRNHRVRGHMNATLDPLGVQRPCPSELELDYYAFTEGELDSLTSCSTLPYDQPLSIREIFQRSARPDRCD